MTDMTAAELNARPHRTTDELAAIPHVTLRVRADARDLPGFLHGTTTVVFHPAKTEDGWTGYHRMPRTGDFYPDPKLFSAVNYEEATR